MLYLSNWTAYTFYWNGVDVAALLYAQKKTDKNLKDVSNQVVNKSKTKKNTKPLTYSNKSDIYVPTTILSYEAEVT